MSEHMIDHVVPVLNGLLAANRCSCRSACDLATPATAPGMLGVAVDEAHDAIASGPNNMSPEVRPKRHCRTEDFEPETLLKTDFVRPFHRKHCWGFWTGAAHQAGSSGRWKYAPKHASGFPVGAGSQAKARFLSDP